MTWLVRHTDYKKYRLFTDEQISGPFESWVHRHQFADENGKTKLTDHISYSIPGGDGVEFVTSWFLRVQLEEMFRYRHFITKWECKSK